MHLELRNETVDIYMSDLPDLNCKTWNNELNDFLNKNEIEYIQRKSTQWKKQDRFEIWKCKAINANQVSLNSS